MRLRSVLICAVACTVLSIGVSYADGMPGPEDDDHYNPVPSVPGVPAKPPAPAATPAPTPQPAPAVQPTPPPVVPSSSSAQTSTPAPAPAVVAKPVLPAMAATTTPAVTPAPAPAGSATVAQKAIYEVTGIDVGLSKDKPTFVTVVVKGTSRSAGWTNAQLKPLQTFAPEVGMRSFTFVATPPTGSPAAADTPIQATIKIEPLPDDVKTIRVLSETNEIAQTFR